MAEKRAYCEHADCTGEFYVRDMEEIQEGFGQNVEIVYVCMPHAELMEDQTGYCSLGCQLGYGCDDSC